MWGEKGDIADYYIFLTLSQTCLQHKAFENTVGKGEIARNEQFLLFHSVFYPVAESFTILIEIVNCRPYTLSI